MADVNLAPMLGLQWRKGRHWGGRGEERGKGEILRLRRESREEKRKEKGRYWGCNKEKKVGKWDVEGEQGEKG